MDWLIDTYKVQYLLRPKGHGGTSIVAACQSQLHSQRPKDGGKNECQPKTTRSSSCHILKSACAPVAVRVLLLTITLYLSAVGAAPVLLCITEEH